MGRIHSNSKKVKKPVEVSLAGQIRSAGPLDRRVFDVSLAMNPAGNKKVQPGRKYNGSASRIGYDNAEYLYMTNSYIRRGTDTNAAATCRNGLDVVPSNTGDHADIDLILQYNNIDIITYDIAKGCELYGVQFVEICDSADGESVRFELLPTPEMDYLRDNSQEILYDKATGRPKGYVQKRNNKEIARWTGKDALRIAEFKYSTLSGGIEGLSSIQSALYPANEYGYIRSSIADSFIRSLPVAQIAIDGATPEDIVEVTNAIGERFTSRTIYVTSERFTLSNSSPANDIDVCKFIEPTLAEIAACFNMPIEMLASTEYMKSDDFLGRYQEWIEHIKMKQKILAAIFEQQIFGYLFEDPVKVKFNNPASMSTEGLIKNVGFAVQSGAITPEMAYEILSKNQVFGTYTPESKGTEKSSTTPQGQNSISSRKKTSSKEASENANVNDA